MKLQRNTFSIFNGTFAIWYKLYVASIVLGTLGDFPKPSQPLRRVEPPMM